LPSRSDQTWDFISVVVSDATRIHTQLLADAIRSDASLQVVASAPDSKDLLEAVERFPVDVAIISYVLDRVPGRGPEVLRDIRRLRPQVKGVILLDSSHAESVVDCFRAGAKGIFSKQDKLENLRKCIRCVHEGQVWASSNELEHVFEALNSSPRVCTANNKGVDLLSAREREVVEYLAAGMTNREIAKALKLSPHTVKNYLFRIFDKLGVSTRTELLYLAMNNPGRSPSADSNVGITSAIAAAESGNPSAQLLLAEHFSQVTAADGRKQDSVSAYMWYLLAEKTAIPLLEHIAEGKKNLMGSLSPEQIVEGENRAAEWLKNSKKKPGVAETDKDQIKAMVANQ
jgi:DNA-binding NarL/FixJ family response regulator